MSYNNSGVDSSQHIPFQITVLSESSASKTGTMRDGNGEEREVQYGSDPLSGSVPIIGAQPLENSGTEAGESENIVYVEAEVKLPWGEKHSNLNLTWKVALIGLIFLGIPALGLGVGCHFGAIEAIKSHVWLNSVVSVGGTAYILIGATVSGGLIYMSVKEYQRVRKENGLDEKFDDEPNLLTPSNDSLEHWPSYGIDNG